MQSTFEQEKTTFVFIKWQALDYYFRGDATMFQASTSPEKRNLIQLDRKSFRFFRQKMEEKKKNRRKL